MSNRWIVRRLIAFVSLVALAALVSANCGGGEDGPSSTASPAADLTATVKPTNQEIGGTPTQEDEPSSTASPAADLTATVKPTDQEIGGTPTQEDQPTTLEAVLGITRPTPNDAVSMVISVEFDSLEFAYVLVRPIPEDPNQQYWAQAAAESQGGNRWISYPVYVGRETDPSGLPFKICVVISDESLSRGQSLPEKPEGPSHCVDVTRE